MTDASQAALLRLQDVDMAIDQHRHRRATLPERGRLAETDAALISARAAYEEVAGRRDQVAGRQQALEADLATAEGRLADVDRRLITGGVGTAREVEALTSSGQHLRARVSELEDLVLEAMEERGPLDEQVEATAAEVSGLEARREEQQRALAAVEDVVDRELAELEQQRSQALAAVPDSLRAAYDRLRPRLGGVAVARLIGDHCDGCHLTLPATEVDRLKHAPAEELAFCDQCGRILVRP